MLFSPVGFNGKLSILEVLFLYFSSRGLMQLDGYSDPDTCKLCVERTGTGSLRACPLGVRETTIEGAGVYIVLSTTSGLSSTPIAIKGRKRLRVLRIAVKRGGSGGASK